MRMTWAMPDGPRSGVARKRGEPHYVACPMADDGEDHAPYFRPAPVDGKLPALDGSQRRIFHRWLEDFHAGKAAAWRHAHADALEAAIAVALAQTSDRPDCGCLAGRLAPPAAPPSWAGVSGTITHAYPRADGVHAAVAGVLHPARARIKAPRARIAHLRL